jgi:hypothetical protein
VTTGIGQLGTAQSKFFVIHVLWDNRSKLLHEPQIFWMPDQHRLTCVLYVVESAKPDQAAGE